jgi:hypothetical protein|tara:strand:+ start:209 stop:808 length:600 start_codon:yes stop_codon:yes gene_type:complete
MDIFEDSTHEGSVSNSLEVDRIKAKVLAVWNQLMAATYEIEYKNQSEDDEDFVSLEDYMEDNKLTFAGEEEETPESEIDVLLEMFDNMLDPQEELEPIESEAKAPTYGSTNLPSYNESLKVPKGTYDGSHASTSIPKDSKDKLKATKYEQPEPGKKLISKTHEVSSPTSIKSFHDILKVEREKLLRLVAKNNKKYGVIL